MIEICRTPSKRKSGGFTLIEIMVTYLLLVVGLLGTAYLQTLSIRYGQQEDIRTYVNIIVANVIEQVRSQGIAANPAVNPPGIAVTPLSSREFGQLNLDQAILRTDCSATNVCFLSSPQQDSLLVYFRIEMVDLDASGEFDHYRITAFWSDRQLARGGGSGEQIDAADCTGQNRIWSTSIGLIWATIPSDDPRLCLTSKEWTFEVQPG